MRLIDMDLAISKCVEDMEAVKDLPQRLDGIRDAVMNIYECPTIDAVPVVRCEDCKYFDSEDDCGCPMDVRYSDFFCKMGERRTDTEIIHQYHERRKEVLKEVSTPVGRNVKDAFGERKTDEAY